MGLPAEGDHQLPPGANYGAVGQLVEKCPVVDDAGRGPVPVVEGNRHGLTQDDDPGSAVTCVEARMGSTKGRIFHLVGLDARIQEGVDNLEEPLADPTHDHGNAGRFRDDSEGDLGYLSVTLEVVGGVEPPVPQPMGYNVNLFLVHEDLLC